jgi:hypothetical protein
MSIKQIFAIGSTLGYNLPAEHQRGIRALLACELAKNLKLKGQRQIALFKGVEQGVEAYDQWIERIRSSA